MSCFAWRGDELRLRVSVIPRSSRSRLGEVADGRLRVHLHAPPSDGRANRELIRLTAKAFSVPRSAITIAAGASVRRKTLCIIGAVALPPVLAAADGLAGDDLN